MSRKVIRMPLPLDVDKHKYVRKSDSLIQNVRYNLSLNEEKIILNIIRMIQPEDKDFATYSISINQFCKILGIKYNGRSLQDIRNTVQSLSDKSFWYEDENGDQVLVRWVTQSRIRKNTSTVEIQLHPEMKPFLLELKELTQYPYWCIAHMRSSYSIRFYEYFRSMLKVEPIFYLSIDKIREMVTPRRDSNADTGSNKTFYERSSDIKRFVIGKSVSEVNKFSDITVKVREEKEGRKLVGFWFEVESKDRETVVNLERETIGVAQNFSQ